MADKLTTEKLDEKQFGRVLHERPVCPTQMPEQRICFCNLTGRYHVVDKDSCCEICRFPEQTMPFAVAVVNDCFTKCFNTIERLRTEASAGGRAAMTDIAERLRLPVRWASGHSAPCPLHVEAAQEIERLRKEIKETKEILAALEAGASVKSPRRPGESPWLTRR